MSTQLNLLLEKKDLNFQQASELFCEIMQGKLSDIELSAALVALKLKGETPDEIAGAAKAMRENASPFIKPGYLCADSCGTGGDGSNTINISTTAALVAAACGLKMVKHGNRSVSSKSGSSDLLKALGINIEMDAVKARECLDETGFTFLFAPLYHVGVKHAMPVRTSLKTRTLFNLLGPLANPAAPEIQLLGVYDPSLCLPMAETLNTLGVKRAMVVHGAGTDEIALHGETQVVEVNNGELKEYTLRAADFGVEEYPLAELEGAGPEQNAQTTLAILKGDGSPAQNAAISANVGALLYLTDQVDSLKSGAEKVQKLLVSGEAIATLNEVKKVSHG